jgi:hypothetical protein
MCAELSAVVNPDVRFRTGGELALWDQKEILQLSFDLDPGLIRIERFEASFKNLECVLRDVKISSEFLIPPYDAAPGDLIRTGETIQYRLAAKRSDQLANPIPFASRPKPEIQNDVHFQGHATSPNRFYNAGNALGIIRKPNFGWIIAVKRSHPFVVREPNGRLFDLKPPRQRRFASSKVAMEQEHGCDIRLHISDYRGSGRDV